MDDYQVNIILLEGVRTMGILKIKGSAKQDFLIDRFIFNVTIRANDKSSGEAVVLGNKRTERFLHHMKTNLGIEPSEFVEGDYSVNQSYGNQLEYSYSRSLTLCTASSLQLVEEITFIMESLSDVEYNIGFELSDEQLRSQQVLQAAIADSKAKAEMIADSLELKIVGAQDAEFDYSELESRNIRSMSQVGMFEYSTLASELQIPVKTISRSISISWETQAR